MRLFVLLSPGVAVLAFALLADVLRGGNLIGDWGTGQTVLSLVGLASAAAGFLVHRKAAGEETVGKRPYWRTVAFIVVPITVLLLTPITVLEAVCRLRPPSDSGRGVYQQPDPWLGFVLKPSRRYRVISKPKHFDVLIRIDEQGFRTPAEGSSARPPQANVFVVGDSHPFGFGINEGETFPEQLSAQLADRNNALRVINAGIPGLGLGQSYRRLVSYASKNPLSADCVVVVFVNPMNDLVNLSMQVDYHFPKPSARLAEGNLAFTEAPRWRGAPFLFSEPFARLNSVFGLRAGPPWYHSAAVRAINTSQPPPPPTKGDITFLEDNTDEQQFLSDDTKRIQETPKLYAARYWPESPEFSEERKTLHELAGAVFHELQLLAESNRWHCVVVVAPEAHRHQSYSREFFGEVAGAVPWNLETGWSRETILELLDRCGLAYVAPEYPQPADAYFIEHDDHTSAEGHRLLAEATADLITEKGWLAEEGTSQER